jgi:hypothetical protein
MAVGAQQSRPPSLVGSVSANTSLRCAPGHRSVEESSGFARPDSSTFSSYDVCYQGFARKPTVDELPGGPTTGGGLEGELSQCDYYM